LKSSRKCGSISKKGYGVGFVSKSKRFMDDSVQDAPGPGEYVGSPRQLNSTPKSTPRGVEKLRHERKERLAQIRKMKLADLHNKNQLPGPGAYEVAETNETIAKRCQTKHASSAFSSRTERGFKKRDSGPAPGEYHRPAMLDSSQRKRPTSSFSSTSRRGVALLLKEMLETPGPGAYLEEGKNDDGPKRLILNPKLRMSAKEAPPSSIFGNAGHDRFGKCYVPRTLSTDIPGPGTYTTHTRPLSSSAATSAFRAAKRKGFWEEWKPPGPAYYKPSGTVRDKRSFHLNATGQWV